MQGLQVGSISERYLDAQSRMLAIVNVFECVAQQYVRSLPIGLGETIVDEVKASSSLLFTSPAGWEWGG